MPRPFKKQFLLLSRTLHIYLSMLAMLTILFFAFTGFLLNHPTWFDLETARTTERTAIVPEEIAGADDRLALVEYLRASEGARGVVKSYSHLEDRTEVHFTGPGRTTQYTVSRPTGDTTIRQETRNSLAFLSDLHKAKYTGSAWPLVVDATSVLLILVSLTGVVLWCVLPKRRTIGLIALGGSLALCAGIYVWLVP